MKTNLMKRLVLAGAALAAAGALAAGSEETSAGLGTNRPPVQTFYIPLPEDQVLTALQTIHGGAGWVVPSDPVMSYVSIAVFVNKTVIYYDQWEDGYERDLANPNHLYNQETNPSGTQIWGDGDPSNGYPPGYPSDVLKAGNIIVLKNQVQSDRGGSAISWDGGDKFGSTKPVAVTRTVWASGSDTLLAGANEIYDTTFFGDSFVCPVGIDTPDQYEVFEYTGLAIQAGPDGAEIEVDADADGTPDYTKTLAEGESYLVNGGVKQGATVTATKGAVQVELLTGDIYDGFESRFIKLLPTKLWSSAYTSPVSTPAKMKVGWNWQTSGTKVWLYNPGIASITVSYETKTLAVKTVKIPAKSSAFVDVSYNYSDASDMSGSRFWTEGKEPFYALATVDSTGTGAASTKKHLGGDNRTWDWGFALIPDNSLSSQIVVGLGIGRDPTSSVNPDENGAPVWVTPVQGDATVYVDYDGDPNTGDLTDANGNHCDASYSLKQLAIAKIYNPAGDQTGMQVYTLDKGVKLAAAWGADPLTTSPGAPGLDMGTGIPPMPEYFMQKSSRLAADNDADGYITPGDEVEYAIQILNVGRQPITDLTLKDTLPAGVSFVANSLKFASNSGTAFDISGADFPLAGDGLDLSLSKNSEQTLKVSGVWTYTYRVKIDTSASNTYPEAITNFAVVYGLGTVISNSVADPLRGRVGDYVWFDANANGLHDAGEPALAGVTVRLLDATGAQVYDDLDRPYETVTAADGAYLFKGVRPGEYKVQFAAPEAYVPTLAKAGADDSVDSDAATNGLTEAFTLKGGQFKLTLDAGFVAGNASVQIVKLAGDAPDGSTLNLGEEGGDVTYTYTVKNTGVSSLRNLVVTDDKLGAVGTIAGPLAPGEVAVLTTNASIVTTTTNIGTVIGTPCAADGGDLVGFTNTVTDADDATVNVKQAEPTGSIGNRVWVDVNGNGIQDAGEMGLYNVTVKLLDETGAVLRTTTTDANGLYLFDNLKAGSYQVQFVPANSAWTFTAKDVGTDDSVDSDADSDGKTEVITLAAGEKNLTVDAGLKAGVPPGICAWIEAAQKFNAFIGGSFHATGGDSEGLLAVRGAATLLHGYSVGLIGPGYGRTREPSAIGTDALVVGGNLVESSAPDMNGNIVYGGEYSNLTGAVHQGVYQLRHVAPVTFDDAWNVPEDGSGKSLAAVQSDLDTFSSVVAALAANGTNDFSDPWIGKLTGTNTFRNIFTLTAEEFAGATNGYSLNVAVPAGSKVLINILGSTVKMAGGSISIPGVDPTRVLFNFVDATTLDTVRFEFPGSVLAPKADASFSGGSINGFAYIGGDGVATNGFEFHDYAFGAFDCSASEVVTAKPALKVTVALNGNAVGNILRNVEGSELSIVETVANVGKVALKGVTFTDVLGHTYDIGDLAVGESTARTAKDTLAANTVYVASATGTPADTAVYTSSITASGSAKAEVVTAEEYASIAAAAAAASAGSASAYVPRPDLEVTALEFVGAKPTLTGEVFSVKATIKNVGEVTVGRGVAVGLYVSHASTVTTAETPDAVKTIETALSVGQSVEVTFDSLTAPAESGAHHVRVIVDSNGALSELSEGNNQLPLFYWLNPIALNIAVNGTHTTLTWNSFEGQSYTIYGKAGLSASNVWTEVKGATAIQATPPLNTLNYESGQLDSLGFHFFRLSVDERTVGNASEIE